MLAQRRRLSRRASEGGVSGVDEVFQELTRDDPPSTRRTRMYPPPETGRNPEAVASDLIAGAVAIPGAVIGLFVVFLFAGYLRFILAPAPNVPLDEALAALVNIEDSYYASGPSIGLRQKITGWFQWAQLDRRLEAEVVDLPGPAKQKATDLGKSAVEFLAGVVEYSGYSANGIVDGRETGRFADRVAAQQASKFGMTQSEDFAAKGLVAGRQALAEALRTINDAREALEDAAD